MLININSCDVEYFTGIMCGMTYNTQGELRKHLRNGHPGASKLIPSLHLLVLSLKCPNSLTVLIKTAHGVTACPKSMADIANGMNALKLWVLSGGWRNATYFHEPGQGSQNSLIRQYCDALERIA